MKIKKQKYNIFFYKKKRFFKKNNINFYKKTNLFNKNNIYIKYKKKPLRKLNNLEKLNQLQKKKQIQYWVKLKTKNIYQKSYVWKKWKYIRFFYLKKLRKKIKKKNKQFLFHIKSFNSLLPYYFMKNKIKLLYKTLFLYKKKVKKKKIIFLKKLIKIKYKGKKKFKYFKKTKNNKYIYNKYVKAYKQLRIKTKIKKNKKKLKIVLNKIDSYRAYYKNKLYLIIRKTRHNWFLLLTNTKGEPLLINSCGNLKIKTKKQKKSKETLEELCVFFFKNCLKYDLNNIITIIYNCNWYNIRHYFKILFLLKKSKFNFNVKNILKFIKTHNGLTKKKKRRI